MQRGLLWTPSSCALEGEHCNHYQFIIRVIMLCDFVLTSFKTIRNIKDQNTFVIYFQFELRHRRRLQLEQAKREKEEQERLERERLERERLEAERELQRKLEEEQRLAAEEEERARSMVNGDVSNELDISTEATNAVEELMKEADVTVCLCFTMWI